MNICLHTRLHAQASAVDTCKESDIQTLLDWLEEVHHQVMRDIVTAKCQGIFVSGPVALHQFRLESLFLEKTFLICGVNWSFTRQADITHADCVRVPNGSIGIFMAACHQQKQAQRKDINNARIHSYVPKVLEIA